MLHEKQKDNLLSESRPELCMKKALQESGLHLHSQRMDKRINYLITLRERRAGYAPNWTEKKDFFKKIIAELKQLCCAEAERVNK